MPKSVSITKEKILDTAFNIARKKGMGGVSNREIAKKLNSSIRPIYYQFKNSEELKKELINKIERYFFDYIFKFGKGSISYKECGMRYISFARDEKNLYKILFMSECNMFCDEFVKTDEYNFSKLQDLVKLSTKLDSDDAFDFHMKMWIFTHGIATLVATDTINFSDEDITNLLSSQYKALMKLEGEKKND